MVKKAIEKGNTKQIRIHARNMVRMRQEVTNYRRISKPLATGNSKKMLKTMDQIETQFFTTELVAKFTNEEMSSLIQKVTDEYNSHATIEDNEVHKINEDDVEVKIKTSRCFRLFACWSH
ncbi:hypothetical protein MKX03_008186 [Papaver bracteatum]|nr:hypothetical protein MKX03_008186 [Papaver bracteatum]